MLQQAPKEIAVVCITNRDIPVPPQIKDNASELLHLCFDDLECKREENNYILPNVDHIKAALAFSKNNEEIIVCCHAGISRSAAIAYLIECTRVKHPALACGIWQKDRHYPNKLIIRLGSELLNDYDVEKFYHKWLTNNYKNV